MAKLRIKAKTADITAIARKNGSLLLDGTSIENFEAGMFGDDSFGASTSASSVTVLKATAAAGDHTATLSVGGKEFSEDFTVEGDTKKVTFKIAKAGIIGMLTGKPFSIKVKVK